MVFPLSLVTKFSQMPVRFKKNKQRVGWPSLSVRTTAGVQILLLSYTMSSQAAAQSFGQAAIQDILDVLDDEVYGHWGETESGRS